MPERNTYSSEYPRQSESWLCYSGWKRILTYFQIVDLCPGKQQFPSFDVLHATSSKLAPLPPVNTKGFSLNSRMILRPIPLTHVRI